MKRILVVDDDDHLRLVLQETLQACDYEVEVAESGQAALDILKSGAFDLIISDLMMPGIKGNELLEKAKKINPDTGFFLISAYGTIETAVDAMKKGAYDFITKPFSISQIEARVEHYFSYIHLQEENKYLKRRLLNHKLDVKMIGQSQVVRDVLHNIDIVAASEASVFILGDSGTGKELIAEAIHDNSKRSDKPFLKINCAAVPDTLFESTLFGHEKGSFSGAYKSQKGIFEECDGGTLLLDEISEMPYNLQAKLLRVLQEMKVTRVGSTLQIPIDVRIIASSNKDIEALVQKKEFREDLFYRLNVFPIRIAPLRQRKEDIPLLAEHFLKVLKKSYKYKEKTFAPETMEMLMEYDWPGNVRQLQHVIERAILFSSGEDVILKKHIILEMQGVNGAGIADRTDLPLMSLAEMEKKMIYKALQQTDNHRTKAADLLGITVRTLRNKLHQFEDGTDIVE